MYKEKLISFLLASVLFTAAAHGAEPKLIAIGAISGLYEDFATETSAPLENGVPGNRLGGFGSGITYAGGNTFLALPDRGPNALNYNAAVDNTTSYINRFHTLKLSLAPNIADPKDPKNKTIENPSQFFVFAFDENDLQGFVPPAL